MGEARIFRVYRRDSVPEWMLEMAINECVVIAENEEQAKGIALEKHTEILCGCSKNEILVEPLKLEVGKVISYR